MRIATPLLTSLIALTAACFPGASVIGDEVAGVDFKPSSAIHFEENDVVFILLAEYPNLCQRILDDDAGIEDLKTLSIIVGDLDEDSSTDDVEPGTYEVGEQVGKLALAGFTETDGNCLSDTSVAATDGEVIVDAYDRRGAAVGTFDLEIDGDDIEGNFRTSECEIDTQDLERDPDECEP